MARELLDHVVEKANPCGDGKSARPIEIDLGNNFGLFCFPFYPRFSQGLVPISILVARVPSPDCRHTCCTLARQSGDNGTRAELKTSVAYVPQLPIRARQQRL